MIVAQRKPFDRIYEMIQSFDKVLVAGCGGCVTVCLTGGEQAVSVLAAELRLKDKIAGRQREIVERTITRQCDAEFVRELAEDAGAADGVLSTACGVGVNYMTEVLEGPLVLPAMDTTFMGANIAEGTWSERCAGCGNCVLDMTGGICPIARCAKSMLNGPCGGSEDGHCEIDPNTPCAWQLIHDRLIHLGRLDAIMNPQPPKNWKMARDGGPRRIVRDDLRLAAALPSTTARARSRTVARRP